MLCLHLVRTMGSCCFLSRLRLLVTSPDCGEMLYCRDREQSWGLDTAAEFCLFFTDSAFSHVPPLLSSTSPLTLHSTIGQRDSSLEPGHRLPQPPVKPTEQSCSRSPAHHPENGLLTSEQLSRLLGKEPLIASRLEFTTNLALMRASQTVIQLQDSPSECTPGCRRIE